jgi:hypothetical protein
MKPEQIETLLRQRPPDEPIHEVGLGLDGAPVSPVQVSRRSTRSGRLGALRWASFVVGLGLVAVLGSLVVGGRPEASASPSPAKAADASPTTPPGAIAWIDQAYVIPTPEPTDPPSALASCDPSRLAMVAGGWGGATGSAAGGVTLVNVSPVPCRLEPPSAVVLRDADGKLVASRPSADGVGLQAIGLPAAGSAWAILVWSNWCGPVPPGPLELELTLPAPDGDAGGDVLKTRMRNDDGGSLTPRCDVPGGGSSIGTLQFQATGEGSGGSDLRACAPADLIAWSGDWGAAAGTWYSEIAVLNVSSFDCLFPSGPRVELRDAHGQVAVAATPDATSPSTFVLPAGSSAGSWLALSDWCTAPPPLPLRADVVLGSARLDVALMNTPYAAIPVPYCNGEPATTPPYFGPEAFKVPGTPEPPPSDPFDSLPMTVTTGPLPPVRPGSVLVYTVTLTNATPFDKPLNLIAFCGSYTERLFLPGESSAIVTRLALNCGPTGIIEPKASATFEMRLAIPANASPGIAMLVWQLGERGEGLKTDFQILGSPSSSP